MYKYIKKSISNPIFIFISALFITIELNKTRHSKINHHMDIKNILKTIYLLFIMEEYTGCSASSSYLLLLLLL